MAVDCGFTDEIDFGFTSIRRHDYGRWVRSGSVSTVYGPVQGVYYINARTLQNDVYAAIQALDQKSPRTAGGQGAIERISCGGVKP